MPSSVAPIPLKPQPIEFPFPVGPVRPEIGKDPADLIRQTDRLRNERQSFKAARNQTDKFVDETINPTAVERTQLQARMAELLLKVGSRSIAEGVSAPRSETDPTPPSIETKQPTPPVAKGDPPDSAVNALPTPPPTAGKVVDLPALADSLFQAGDHEGALGIYRLMESTVQSNQDRIAIQYQIACCFRKLGRLNEAAALYREIISADQDRILADCATWQLEAIRWRRDLESQLQQIRQRREKTMK